MQEIFVFVQNRNFFLRTLKKDFFSSNYLFKESIRHQQYFKNMYIYSPLFLEPSVEVKQKNIKSETMWKSDGLGSFQAHFCCVTVQLIFFFFFSFFITSL